MPMKARILSERDLKRAYDKGVKDGMQLIYPFFALALNNSCGWTAGEIQRVLTETGRIAEETQKEDPDDWVFRINRKMEELGVGFKIRK